MIHKNNRFFGRDISNLVPSLARNPSQELPDKRPRRHSMNMADGPKPSLNLQQKKDDVNAKIGNSTQGLNNCVKRDIQCVPEYFKEILGYMREKQSKIIGNYCEKTINIDKASRGELMNWVIEVHHKFKLFPQTLYFVVYFIDKYLAQRNVQKSKFKLVAISALYLASKYEETYRVPQMKDLLNLCSYSYTKRQILETEADIVNVLKFDLVLDSSYKFLQALEVYSGINRKNFHLAQYLLELSLTQSEFLEYSQSLLACSAFYLVCKIRKVEINWEKDYEELTKFKQTELHKCARELCNLLEKIESLSHISSLKKKFSEAQYHEVTRLKLERKK